VVVIYTGLRLNTGLKKLDSMEEGLINVGRFRRDKHSELVDQERRCRRHPRAGRWDPEATGNPVVSYLLEVLLAEIEE